MEFEEFIVKAGRNGRYQWRIGLLLSLADVTCGFQTLAILFTAATPDHFCQLNDGAFNRTASFWSNTPDGGKMMNTTDGATIESSECSLYMRTNENGENITKSVKCSAWDYETEWYDTTIVNKWDLVCDSQWFVATAGSLFMAGFMVGSFAFGILSDKFGRKMPFLLATFLQVIIGVTTAFSPNYVVFVILRVANGIVSIGQVIASFVLCMEISGDAGRAIFGFIYMTFWSVGYTILTGIAYLVRDWWKLQLIATIPSLLMLSYYFIIPESPRWLLLHGREEEAQVIMKQMAEENGHPEVDVTKVHAAKGNPNTGTYLDLVRTPRLRLRSFTMAFVWVTNSLVYYGLTFNTGNLAGNPYVNHAIGANVENVSSLLSIWVIEKLGRRIPQLGAFFICGVTLVAMLAVPADLGVITIVLSMTGKFLITSTFGIAYIYTAEVFPTLVRNQAVGGGSFAARIGSIVAPYVAQLGNNNVVIPSVIFGGCSIISACLIFFVMPETKGRVLPDSIEDGERLGTHGYKKEPNTGNGVKSELKSDIHMDQVLEWTKL